MNINLNAGGIVGAILGGAAVGFLVIGGLEDTSHFDGKHAKLIIAGLVGGAVVGNVLWGLVFKKKEPAVAAPATPEKPAQG